MATHNIARPSLHSQDTHLLPALKPRLLVLLSGPAPAVVVVVLVGILGNNDNNYLIIQWDSLPCSYRGFIYEAMKRIAQPSHPHLKQVSYWWLHPCIVFSVARLSWSPAGVTRSGDNALLARILGLSLKLLLLSSFSWNKVTGNHRHR